MTTLMLQHDLAMTVASPEGVTAARGVLSLFAFVSLWALLFAVRQVTKAVSILFRLTLFIVAVAALGAMAVAVIAQVALAIGITGP